MIFQIYFKDKIKNSYSLNEITTEANTDINFFRKLKIQIEMQQDEIRNDMTLLMDEKSTITKPYSYDLTNQKLLIELIKFRKNNTVVLEQLKSNLLNDDVIVCEHCKGWMRKLPLNVNYERVGNNIIIKEENLVGIKYIYACDNCPLAISEDNYNWKLEDIKIRAGLII